MSTISMEEFLEKSAQDPELGEKLAAILQKHDEKVRALAAQAGYELEEAVPLSDEEAEAAAGGMFEYPSGWGLKPGATSASNFDLREWEYNNKRNLEWLRWSYYEMDRSKWPPEIQAKYPSVATNTYYDRSKNGNIHIIFMMGDPR